MDGARCGVRYDVMHGRDGRTIPRLFDSPNCCHAQGME